MGKDRRGKLRRKKRGRRGPLKSLYGSVISTSRSSLFKFCSTHPHTALRHPQTRAVQSTGRRRWASTGGKKSEGSNSGNSPWERRA